MKIGGELGGFTPSGDQFERANNFRDLINEEYGGDYETALREHRQPVEIDPAQVQQKLESIRRLGENLSPEQVRQAVNLNNPLIREAYTLWQNEQANPRPQNVVQLDDYRNDDEKIA